MVRGAEALLPERVCAHRCLRSGEGWREGPRRTVVLAESCVSNINFQSFLHSSRMSLDFFNYSLTSRK